MGIFRVPFAPFGEFQAPVLVIMARRTLHAITAGKMSPNAAGIKDQFGAPDACEEPRQQAHERTNEQGDCGHLPDDVRTGA